MNLVDLLELKNKKALVSIAGGGGKTTTLFELGKGLCGYSVLLTTTTKIMKPAPSPLYRILEDSCSDTGLWDEIKKDRSIPLVYGCCSDAYPGKLTGVSFSFLKEAREFFEYIIVESDGSARRPLKAPASHEPVISPETDIFIGIIGLDALFQKGDETTVHRPELFASIRFKDPEEPVTKDDLIRLINHREGLFKNAPPNCRKVILLNKADLIVREEGEDLCRQVKRELIFEGTVALNSYKESDPILFSL